MQTTRLEYGQAVSQQFESPVLIFGSQDPNHPKMAITLGVHGDEDAGFLIVERLILLINSIELKGELKGTVYIVLSANAAAQLEKKRVSSFDHKDLNRVAKGNKKGSLTERKAAVLFEFLSHQDFVINIHNFEMLIPITAVYMNAGNSDVRRRSLEAIKAFDPQMIWVINNGNNHDLQYAITLDTALAEAGVPNFPIETNQLAYFADEEIQRAVQGIRNVMAYLGIIKENFGLISQSQAPAFTRHEFTSDHSGLWRPCVSLMENIEFGAKLGTLKVFPTFEEMPVFSSTSGTLIQIRPRQIVHTGQSLFSVGESAEPIINKVN